MLPLIAFFLRPNHTNQATSSSKLNTVWVSWCLRLLWIADCVGLCTRRMLFLACQLHIKRILKYFSNILGYPILQKERFDIPLFILLRVQAFGRLYSALFITALFLVMARYAQWSLFLVSIIIIFIAIVPVRLDDRVQWKWVMLQQCITTRHARLTESAI